MMLSDQIRVGIDSTPWVHQEVKRLEAQLAEETAKRQDATEALIEADKWLAECARLLADATHSGNEGAEMTRQEWAEAYHAWDNRTTARAPVAPVLAEVVAERARQDAKWGGPAHDDTHSEKDFGNFIRERIGTYPTRKGLIQIAALAVAAVESMDRRAAYNAPGASSARANRVFTAIMQLPRTEEKTPPDYEQEELERMLKQEAKAHLANNALSVGENREEVLRNLLREALDAHAMNGEDWLHLCVRIHGALETANSSPATEAISNRGPTS